MLRETQPATSLYYIPSFAACATGQARGQLAVGRTLTSNVSLLRGQVADRESVSRWKPQLASS